jgi:hypothetical protein
MQTLRIIVSCSALALMFGIGSLAGCKKAGQSAAVTPPTDTAPTVAPPTTEPVSDYNPKAGGGYGLGAPAGNGFTYGDAANAGGLGSGLMTRNGTGVDGTSGTTGSPITVITAAAELSPATQPAATQP